MHVLARAAAVLAVVVIAGAVLTSTAGAAPSASGPAGAHVFQVVRLAPNGQPVSTRPVSESTFMQMRDHVRQQAMQRARAQVVPALGPDIHRVSDQDCATRNDFFKLWNDTTSAYGVCFAGDGPIDINVYNVYEIDSGNNSGNFVAAVNSHFPGNGLQMCAWSSALFDSGIYHANLYDVTQVTITGRSSSPCQPSTVYQV